ncbi:hypothetical protein ES707_17074 [subsurface metagenome]
MRLLHDVEGSLAGSAGHFHPAGQDVVELQRGEIGFDAKLALVIAAADLADQLDRQRAGDRRTQIEAESRAAGIVERRRKPDVGIALGGLPVVERGLLAIDLDVALDLIAGIVGRELQRIGFQLLVHHQLVDRKAGEVGGHIVGRIGLGDRALDRQAHVDDGGEVALARIGIDQGRRKIAQPVRGENFRRRGNGTIDANPDFRRRRLDRHIRHFETEVREVDFASRRRVGDTLADRHQCGAPGDFRFQVSIANRRHLIHRTDRHAGGDDVDRKTVVGNRRSLARQIAHRRVESDIDALQLPFFDPLEHPFAQFRHHQDRPHALQRRGRHRRARKAKLQARLAGVVHHTGAGDADLAIGQIGLRQQHALAVDIEAKGDIDPVEYQRLLVLGAGQHDGAAGKAGLPIVDLAVRRLQMRQQRHAVCAGGDLERRHQHAAVGIPLDVHFGRVDRHRIVGRIAVDDVAGARTDLAAEIGRHAVAAEFALQFARQRQVGAVSEILHPHRQEDVGGRKLVGLDVDGTHAVSGRTNRHLQRPRLCALFAEAQRDAAAARTPQAQAYVLERPFVAALLVVDDKVAVLQADFVEVLSVETGEAETVEPVEAGENAGLCAVRCGRSRATCRRRRHRDLAGERGGKAGLLLGGDAGRERFCGVARGHRDLAVRRDANGKLGIDEIEAFGAQPAHQQRHAGEFHFGLRRGGDDGAVAVAHDDVADAHGDTDSTRALDLRAANLDRVAMADIFLDRRGEPGRGDIEIDRPRTEPPPQPAEADEEDDGERRHGNREPFHPAFADHPAPQRAEAIADAVNA